MHTHIEELTWLVSPENGKTYGETKAEVLKAIECAERMLAAQYCCCSSA